MLPAEIDTIVIGGGASGMMAAVFAAEAGEKVLLLEKNEKTGKKLYITGKGRCNLTNACDTEDIFPQVVSGAKFLYSCIYGFSNFDVMAWFESHGLKLKEERGGRVFPASDKSSDVIRVVAKACEDAGVTIALQTEVKELLIEENRQEGESERKGAGHQSERSVRGVRLKDGREIACRRVILATGGVSYPSTGSTGDGYRMAEASGHTIVEPRPGLTGLTTVDDDIFAMQGLTLTNTRQIISSEQNKKAHRKPLLDGFGEILFTHFGVSGPTMLTASSVLGDRLKKEPLMLSLDVKPALTEEQLDQRLLREIEADGKKSVGNLMGRLLPKSMIPVLLGRCSIDTATRSLDLTREQRQSIVREIKDFRIQLGDVRGFNEAIITRGGVSLKEVDPHTMESRLVSGLYLVGELLDIDALTGGYNLQIAWSTGALAGRSGNL